MPGKENKSNDLDKVEDYNLADYLASVNKRLEALETEAESIRLNIHRIDSSLRKLEEKEQ